MVSVEHVEMYSVSQYWSEYCDHDDHRHPPRSALQRYPEGYDLPIAKSNADYIIAFRPLALLLVARTASCISKG